MGQTRRSANRVRGRVSAVPVAIVLALSTASPAVASSVGYPPRFWDGNNDGQVNGGDANVGIQGAGPDWTTTKETSAASAATEWRTDTHYNPTFDPVVGLVFTFVDGRQPACGSFTSTNYAAACVYTTLRYYPGSTEAWLDIYDADVYLNKNDFSWNYGTAAYDASDPRPSFRGVLTHEYGHVAGLRHEPTPCSSPLPTMCPSASFSDTYSWRSLESTDVSSVNNRY